MPAERTLWSMRYIHVVGVERQAPSVRAVSRIHDKNTFISVEITQVRDRKRNVTPASEAWSRKISLFWSQSRNALTQSDVLTLSILISSSSVL